MTQHTDNQKQSKPPYYVNYTLWKRENGNRVTKTFEGVYGEPSPIDCVNAIVYEIRGQQTAWELAYVNEIERVTNRDN